MARGRGRQPTHVFSTRCTVARCVSLRCSRDRVDRSGRVVRRYLGRNVVLEIAHPCDSSRWRASVFARARARATRRAYVFVNRHPPSPESRIARVRRPCGVEREIARTPLYTPSFRGGKARVQRHSARRWTDPSRWCRGATSGRRRRERRPATRVALRSASGDPEPRLWPSSSSCSAHPRGKKERKEETLGGAEESGSRSIGRSAVGSFARPLSHRTNLRIPRRTHATRCNRSCTSCNVAVTSSSSS